MTTATIAPASLTASGITTNNKIYDGTTVAKLNLGAASVAGMLGSDVVTLNTSAAVGTFASVNVGNNLRVTVSGLALGGPQAANYTVRAAFLLATITPAPLTVTGVVANNKVYDGTTPAALSTTNAALVGLVSGDNVSLVTSAAVGRFISPAVATNSRVVITGLTITGTKAFDYALTQPAARAAITARALTIAALPATKIYDSSTSATAVPTVSGLAAGDSVTGLAEVFSDGNVGSSKTLSVSTYSVNDGNSGNNYTVTTVVSTAGTINSAPFTGYAVNVLGGSSFAAGASFLVTVQAVDSFGNAVLSYSGPGSVTATTSADSTSHPPATVALNGGGFGFFVETISAAGSATITAAAGAFTGTSAAFTITPDAAAYFTVAANSTAITGSPSSIVIQALDSFGNLATGYNGTIHFSSSDSAAVLPGNAVLSGGAGSFNVTFKTPGIQTVTATDVTAANPAIAGTSDAITTRGLTITAFTPTPDGFIASFSEPFVSTNVALYSVSATAVSAVTLMGTNGAGRVNGSLLIDPFRQTIQFKATTSKMLQENQLLAGHDSPVLPDATYTVTLVSGAHGFIDGLGMGLDGGNTGGQANFVTTFTTHYQASANPVVGVPDFARGPDGTAPITVPNNAGYGIPLTLYNASGTTDVTFTLTYNPSLLNISAALGGAGSDASDPTSAVHAGWQCRRRGHFSLPRRDSTIRYGRSRRRRRRGARCRQEPVSGAGAASARQHRDFTRARGAPVSRTGNTSQYLFGGRERGPCHSARSTSWPWTRWPRAVAPALPPSHSLTPSSWGTWPTTIKSTRATSARSMLTWFNWPPCRFRYRPGSRASPR